MLIYKETNDNYILGIWKIEESADTLLSLLNKETSEDFRRTYTSENRLLEKAATKLLLNELTEDSLNILYKSNGKPYLENDSRNISISHTKGYAAIILSGSEHSGIDIEYISDRVKRIQSRFISAKEYIDPDNEINHLLLHWSAKETMYKALSREGVVLNEDFIIEKFIPSDSGIIVAKETFSEKQLCFNIQYFISDDYVLTYTV